MTQPEIKEALRICGHTGACALCPLRDLSAAQNCMRLLMLNALDVMHADDILIADKDAERRLLRHRVKELSDEKTKLEDDLMLAEGKVIRRFLKKLKAVQDVDRDGYPFVYVCDIDETARKTLRDTD